MIRRVMFLLAVALALADPALAQHTTNPGGSGGGGGVSSVGFTVPGGFTVSGQPIVAAGTIALGVSGTSGGILCYTAATTSASSGILNTNILVKGGGAGACPTNSLWTDDGTTSTYAGTGGISTPKLTTTGTNGAANTTCIAAPGAGAAGTENIYCDSTTKVASAVDDAGNVMQMFRPLAAVASKWINSIPASGIPTQTQPAFSDLSGTATGSQLPIRTICLLAGADNGPALANADIGPQNDQWVLPYAATLLEVMVIADAGTPSSLARKTNADHTTNTALLSGALSTAANGVRACSKTSNSTSVIDGATSCTNTLQNTSLAQGITFGVASGTAGGVAKKLNTCLAFQ